MFCLYIYIIYVCVCSVYMYQSLYVVINDDLNRCFKEISKIIDNVILSKKVIFNKATIKNHVKKLIS